jgi:drug/metabolite transporter (DMT)-like permease
MYRAQLSWKPILILLVLALIWGANMAFIKFAARDVTPLFMAGLRSAVASAVVFLWIGVFLSGALMLGEAVTLRLLTALTLVSAGMVMVNHRPEKIAASRTD